MEMESQVTYPIETALAGIPNLELYPISLSVWPVTSDGNFQRRDGYLFCPTISE